MKKLFTMLALVLAFAVTGCAGKAGENLEHGAEDAEAVVDTTVHQLPGVVSAIEAFAHGDVDTGIGHLLTLAPQVEHDADAIKAGLRKWHESTKADSTAVPDATTTGASN